MGSSQRRGHASVQPPSLACLYTAWLLAAVGPALMHQVKAPAGHPARRPTWTGVAPTQASTTYGPQRCLSICLVAAATAELLTAACTLYETTQCSCRTVDGPWELQTKGSTQDAGNCTHPLDMHSRPWLRAEVACNVGHSTFVCIAHTRSKLCVQVRITSVWMHTMWNVPSIIPLS